MKNRHYRAFGSLFFLLHQGKLLWLLNAPIIGRWFRRILRISGESSSVGSRRIFRILPHAIFWWHGNKQIAEFRTHAKFSKRLYFAFRTLWWAMHAWDWCVADRWVPELSFGFSTLTKYPDADPETNTVDGYVAHTYNLGSGVDWAVLVAGVGTSAVDTALVDSGVLVRCDNVTDKYRQINRSIFLFNTAALTAYASISAAVMSISSNFKFDDGTLAPNVDIYTSAPASDTALAAGDFDSFGSESQTGSPISYASWSTAGYNDFTFNATGRGNISKTGISKFGARNQNYDVASSPPAWTSTFKAYLDFYYAEQTGTTDDPKLVVTYTTEFFSPFPCFKLVP